MPTISENHDRWQQRDWSQAGNEWSPGRSAEGTHVLWQRTILPRVQRFVPTDTILEIGPGFGRWTEFLRHLCRRLIVVDLSARCIDACRERFAGDDRIEYIVNDGASLEAVPDGSVDFIFSFDSLVHAEADAIGRYLAQAAMKLKPNGAGFVHHSNLNTFVDPNTKSVRWFVTRKNWRAESVSADVFQRLCEGAGLSCRSQELINWLGKSLTADRHHLAGKCIPLTDCFSVFTTGTKASTKRLANPFFVDEWRQAVWMAQFYYGARTAAAPRTATGDRLSAGHPVARKLRTIHAVRDRAGWRGVAALMGDRMSAVTEQIASAMRARLVGEANRWFLRTRVLRTLQPATQNPSSMPPSMHELA